MKQLYFSLSALFFILLTGCTPGDLEDVTAFIHVNVIPMHKEGVLPDQTVLVQDGRIIAVGKSNKIKIPESANVIDGTGKYLLPGLTDMHMHSNTNWNDKSLYPVSPLSLSITGINIFVLVLNGHSLTFLRYVRRLRR